MCFQTPKPVAATPQPPKPRRKNIFDSDSDEDFLKPKVCHGFANHGFF